MTKPKTPITLATINSSKALESWATKIVQVLNKKTHKSNEPSCPPHTAPIRYITGI